MAVDEKPAKSRGKSTTKYDSKLAQTFMAAMVGWDQMKAAGATLEARVRGLAGMLRGVWPFTREWHYVCDGCDDTGWILHQCRRGARCPGISTRHDGPNMPAGKYRRLCAQHPESDYEHDYVSMCFCARGLALRSQPKAPADFAEAGKSTKKSGFTKAGR